MSNHSTYLFTESAFGGLPLAAASDGGSVACDRFADPAPPTPSFVERLGFPQGTDPALLAQVLEHTRATPPGTRVDRLRSPGVLCRLFSQSAADASYALAILSIVESPGFDFTLAQLKAADAAAAHPSPAPP